MKSFILLALGLAASCAPVIDRRAIELQNGATAGRPRRPLGSSFGIPGNATFDYVVVGGGTAGLTVAARLAQDGTRSVAVIEAGSFYEIGNGNLSEIPLFGPAGAGKSPTDVPPIVDWGFFTTPQTGYNNQVAHYARGKCLGGSSARNFLTYQRSNAQAYQQWANNVGDQSYTFTNMLPYFQKSLTFTPPDSANRPANATPQYDTTSIGNSRGPISVTFARYAMAFSSWAQKAYQQLGIKPINGLTSGSILGSSYQLLTIDATSMLRESSETGFLRKIGLQQPNLIIYQSTLAKKILFDSTKRATGVVIQIGQSQVPFTLTARKEVILSAGAFQSPQLLMVSGVGPAATLQKHGIPVVSNLAGVGQNMQDHILGGPSYRVNVVTTSQLGNPAFAAAAATQFDTSASGILTDAGADLLAWEKLPQTLRSNMSKSALADLATLPADWPEIEFFATSAYYGFQENYLLDSPTDGANYATVAVALQAPFSRGTVDISSADAADAPIINPNWLTHPTDQAVAVAGYKRVRQVFQTQAMQSITVGPEFFPGANVSTDAQILDMIRQSFSTVFHASCTCKMGNSSDSTAVVDAQARVFGVQGLRVVDASSFALLPPGHPIATICEYILVSCCCDFVRGAQD